MTTLTTDTQSTNQDFFIENGAIKSRSLMYREVAILPLTAAKCIAAILHHNYSHVSERNKMMYVYHHKANSPSGVDLYDSFPMGCMAIYKELKNPLVDLWAYAEIVEGF